MSEFFLNASISGPNSLFSSGFSPSVCKYFCIVFKIDFKAMIWLNQTLKFTVKTTSNYVCKEIVSWCPSQGIFPPVFSHQDKIVVCLCFRQASLIVAHVSYSYFTSTYEWFVDLIMSFKDQVFARFISRISRYFFYENPNLQIVELIFIQIVWVISLNHCTNCVSLDDFFHILISCNIDSKSSWTSETIVLETRCQVDDFCGQTNFLNVKLMNCKYLNENFWFFWYKISKL